MQDLVYRVPQQLKPHEDDDHRDRKTGKILDASVSKGVIRIRLLAGKLEAKQRDGARARVREVVERVRRDGDGAGDRAGKELEREKNDIQADTHDAAEHAVRLPHGGGGDILTVPDEFFSQ